MRLFNAVLAGAALALAPMMAAGPAMAQDNGPLGQVQRFLNGNNNNNNNERNAYEQGRLDQQRQEQARRERWRQEHAQNNSRYQQPRGTYETGPGYREGYNGYNGYNQGYDTYRR